MVDKKKLFLASSSELKADRQEFEIFINRKNNDWIDRGVFLQLIVWEDFLDALSKTRLQDEYNTAIRDSDIFVMLFHTKVGQYTEEEFETAFGQFRATNKPFIYTYFKDVEVAPGSVSDEDQASLRAFQKKLDRLGHFYTRYRNREQLKYHFNRQLDKLAAGGFVEFKSDTVGDERAGGSGYQGQNGQGSVVAQGEGATAVGPGGVIINGTNSGDINTRTKIDTGGAPYVGGDVHIGGDFVGQNKITYGSSSAEIDALFAPLLAAIRQQAPAERRGEAVEKATELQAEVAKDNNADDGRIAKIVDGLAKMIPGAIGNIVSLFTSPLLKHVAGRATKAVLEKLKAI